MTTALALDPHHNGSSSRFNVTVEAPPSGQVTSSSLPTPTSLHLSAPHVVTPTGGVADNNNNNSSTAASGMSRSGKSRFFKPLKQPLDPAVCSKAARYAVRVYDEMSKRSLLLAEENSNHAVPLFDRDDILPRLGELLGKGGFNSVYELRTAPPEGDSRMTSGNQSPLRDVRTGLPASSSSPQASSSQPQHPPQTPPGQNNHNDHQTLHGTSKQLAVKFLSDDAMMVPEEFCNGAADLLMEAKYLTALAAHPHPSLIQLHGVCSAGPSGFSLADRAGFFLVIDRLYDTLGRRMDVWRELSRRRSGQHRVLQAMFLQRLMVAQDIASALRHLHKLNVVFRDLKPDNVGFDYAGAVKIFDFGLAKELDPKQKTESGMYKMSGGTGSRRYMSPEVALNENYSLSADLYSFAILFWEVLTLRKAFAYLPVEEHRDRVIKNDERPELDAAWSPGIRDVLVGCWARNPFQRPPARDVYRAIRAEIQAIYVDEFCPNHHHGGGGGSGGGADDKS